MYDPQTGGRVIQTGVAALLEQRCTIRTRTTRPSNQYYPYDFVSSSTK